MRQMVIDNIKKHLVQVVDVKQEKSKRQKRTRARGGGWDGTGWADGRKDGWMDGYNKKSKRVKTQK